ncbi:hypothetical protein K431DRAFT_294037 [Polychaeton citri CBS 116435]|uniref:Uncharacterized protein n=1 Tax=Polychaeton citri CBS 116435 TaxID=1314669 RepID=A0A9P4UQB1_9PEZI|nr:hypothetical protein K431DRAFT_294037 [Polychaeton citri CBS 116435]
MDGPRCTTLQATPYAHGDADPWRQPMLLNERRTALSRGGSGGGVGGGMRDDHGIAARAGEGGATMQAKARTSATCKPVLLARELELFCALREKKRRKRAVQLVEPSGRIFTSKQDKAPSADGGGDEALACKAGKGVLHLGSIGTAKPTFTYAQSPGSIGFAVRHVGPL